MNFDDRIDLIEEVEEWNEYESKEGNKDSNSESQGTTHYTPD